MKKMWKSLGWVALYTLTYLVASFMVGIVFAIVVMISELMKDPAALKNMDIATMIGESVHIILIATSALSLIFLMLIGLMRKIKFTENVHYKPMSLKFIGIIIMIGISLNFIISIALQYILTLFPMESAMKAYEEMISSIMTQNPWLTLLTVGILVPIFEELFFRGFIYGELKRGMHRIVAIILQAVIFGIFHGNWIQGVYAFVLGIVLALVLEYTDSILGAIGVHMCFNTTSVLLGIFVTEQWMTDYSLVLFGVSFIVMLVGCMLLLKQRVIVDSTEQIL